MASVRRIVAERAFFRCEYCLSPSDFSPGPFSVEHVIPRATGGTDDLENLAFSCQGCNNCKYVSTTALDSATGSVVPLYHPREHSWADHFAWSEDFTLIVGLTQVGRATVARLRLNRLEVVNLRRVLRLVGEHPPLYTIRGSTDR